METFELRGLSFAYPGQAKNTLTDVTLSVGQGEFLVICGPSGSGKSTLLRQLKTVLTPEGRRSGDVLFQGRPLSGVDRRTQSRSIGFVQQSPENQIVTDRVWHELAFGLESLGLDTDAIRRRVAEMAGFFGIEDWFYRDVSELSGGQKQLLSLASIMVMQPSALILDEPTAQLDPIAAGDFFAVLGRINRELGTTVILSEQRLEEAFSLCTRVAVLDGGRLLCAGTPEEAGPAVRDAGSSMLLAMPTATRVWCAAKGGGACPVSVREGRDWLAEFCRTHEVRALPPEPERRYSGETALEARQLWFRYEKEQPDVVKGLSLSVRRGEFLAILGGNGAGKTTSLMLLAGILRPYRGEVGLHGSVGVLPQGAQTLFVKKTVREDLLEIISESGTEREARLAHVAALCRLGGLLDRHPYDLSGGEQQRAALAKLLLTGPDILLLDEATKGLDAEFKRSLAEILRSLLERGVSVVMVSHDVEFCARYAHRCALFFDGGIVAEGTPGSFFAGNSFYTTAANRMARGILPGAVTAEDIIACCGGEVPEAEALPEEPPPMPREKSDGGAGRAGERLPWARKLGAALSGGAALALFLHIVRVLDLSPVLDFGGVAWRQAVQYFALFAALFVFALCVTRRGRPERQKKASPRRRRPGRRSVVAAALILLMIPLTLLGGALRLGGENYYFISLLVILEAMLPFFLVFEGSRPQARELVIIAALCAISVAGRAAFFMLPQFKPVLAMTIIVGAALGGETGFLVGAMTMLVSNIFFSQGPWTPWQMFAMGIIGFLAGLLFHTGPLRRTRGGLCVFGALSAVVIYGGIMNPSSALMWMRELNWEMLATYYASGFPMDCVHGAGTALFLWLAAEPMLEKLERIKVKYGLDE